MKKILKIVSWTLGLAIGLLLLMLAIISFWLTPERLTPLIEKYGSRYLLAEVKLDRAELSVWSTFPKVELDLKGLELTSKSLDSAPSTIRERLPEGYQHLLSLKHFNGAINPWSLLRGTVALGDITIENINANLVVADSLANYNIVPPSEESSEHSKLARIELSNVKIVGPSSIKYCSITDSLTAKIDISKILLTHATTGNDNYDLEATTTISLSMSGVPRLSNIPLAISTDFLLTQSSPKFSTDNLHVSLATIGANIATAINLDEMTISRLAIDTDPIDIIGTLALIPKKTIADIPAINGIGGNPRLKVSASLRQPYSLTSGQIPDIDADINIPQCHINYTQTDGKQYTLDNFVFASKLSLDGNNPESDTFEITNLTLKGDGADISLNATASDILGTDPIFDIEADGTLDFGEISAILPPDMRNMLRGSLDIGASARFKLSDITEMALQKIVIDGHLNIHNLLLSLPEAATRLWSKLIRLSFGSNITDYIVGHGTISGLLRADGEIRQLDMETDGTVMSFTHAHIAAGSTARLLDASKKKNELIPLGLTFESDDFHMHSDIDSTKVHAKGLKVNGSVMRGQADGMPTLDVAVRADAIRYADPEMHLKVRDFDASITANLRRQQSNTGIKKKYSARNDSATAGINNEVIKIEMDAGLKSMIQKLGLSGNISARRVGLFHKSYPALARLTNLNLDFSLDSIRLHRAHLVSESNSLTLSGTIRNLRRFMLGKTRRPIEVRLTAFIDSLDINQISYNYERGLYDLTDVPETEDLDELAASIPVDVKVEHTDSVPLLVPRNIDAEIALNAGKIRFTDINLYDASGIVYMKDGAFSVDSVEACTDFGSAYLNLLYSSRNIYDLNLSLDVGFDRVNITDFFNTFPKVRDMMPVAYNLRGLVSANLTGSLGLYPNMDINFGSINALLNISGNELAVNQDPFIRKIMRMMLIRKKGEVPITDMNIQLSIHDNMMRLYPFSFSMDRYRFAVLGENDFNENMYYHLSVLKSPIPFKFGINIKGTFDKPKIRFGGAKFKENEAREIGNLVETHRVNFVKEMRMQLHKLVRKAALSYSRREPKPMDYNDSESDESISNPIELVSSETVKPVAKFLRDNSDVIDNILQQLTSDNKKKKKDKRK